MYLTGIESEQEELILMKQKRSNCTLLELKEPHQKKAYKALQSSNCTLLELKVCSYVNTHIKRGTSSNCTLLELKDELRNVCLCVQKF